MSVHATKVGADLNHQAGPRHTTTFPTSQIDQQEVRR